jgi:hypothetical protein
LNELACVARNEDEPEPRDAKQQQEARPAPEPHAERKQQRSDDREHGQSNRLGVDVENGFA